LKDASILEITSSSRTSRRNWRCHNIHKGAPARLPPGKAPLSLVKSKFSQEINQDVIEAIIPRFFHETAAKEGLQVVGKPNVVDVHFHAGEPIKFKAEFEVAPTVELGEYRGVAVTYAEPEVTDADIAERIEASGTESRICQRRAPRAGRWRLRRRVARESLRRRRENLPGRVDDEDRRRSHTRRLQ
jgi:hypothetical protein